MRLRLHWGASSHLAVGPQQRAIRSPGTETGGFSTWATMGPPHIWRLQWQSCGKITWQRLARMSPENVHDAMLRRVLRLHCRFLAAGFCRLSDGSFPQPLLELEHGRLAFSAWQTVLVTGPNAADSGMNVAREVYPWVGCCTCGPSRTRSPWCLLLSRVFHIDDINVAQNATNAASALSAYGLTLSRGQISSGASVVTVAGAAGATVSLCISLAAVTWPC